MYCLELDSGSVSRGELDLGKHKERQGYIFCKILWWHGGGKKIKTKIYEKKIKRGKGKQEKIALIKRGIWP